MGRKMMVTAGKMMVMLVEILKLSITVQMAVPFALGAIDLMCSKFIVMSILVSLS